MEFTKSFRMKFLSELGYKFKEVTFLDKSWDSRYKKAVNGHVKNITLTWKGDLPEELKEFNSGTSDKHAGSFTRGENQKFNLDIVFQLELEKLLLKLIKK